MAGIVNIGFGSAAMTDKIVAIIMPDSKPSMRLREAAKKENRLLDATQGHKTRAIIVTSSNHVILCGINPDTLVQRIRECDA